MRVHVNSSSPGAGAARLLAIWAKSPERVLATLLIGNTLVNIGAGALAGDLAHDLARVHGWPQGTVIAVATAVTTSVILFLGEIIPKTLAKRHPIQVSLSAIPFVQLLYLLLWPLTTGLVRITNVVVSAFGGARAPTPAVTSAEIEYLIEMGTREGVLDAVKEELLNSVLEFADRVVKEVMVPRTRMAAIDRDAPPEEILRIVTENPYSRMPVYRDSIDNVMGVLLVREIIPELAKGPKGVLATIDRHLKPPFFVPEQMKISRLLKEMQKRKTHLAIVVDEFGGTSGLATLEDVIEEIVGEIQDEGDVEAAPVREVAPGVYLADASVPLRELESFLNERIEGAGEDRDAKVRFPEEGDYETLGGFVTATAGRVPPVGSLLAWDGLHLHGPRWGRAPRDEGRDREAARRGHHRRGPQCEPGGEAPGAISRAAGDGERRRGARASAVTEPASGVRHIGELCAPMVVPREAPGGPRHYRMTMRLEHGKPDLRASSLSCLAGELARLGEKPYRARQLFRWLHQRGAASFGEMTDLPRELQARLAERFDLYTLTMEEEHRSSDGTIKWKWRTVDGRFIESVYMPHGDSADTGRHGHWHWHWHWH